MMGLLNLVNLFLYSSKVHFLENVIIDLTLGKELLVSFYLGAELGDLWLTPDVVWSLFSVDGFLRRLVGKLAWRE